MPNQPADTEQLPITGDHVGRWLLGNILGVGGMATVYAATGPEDQLVAVKVLHPGKTDDEEARRFKREFLILRSLRHPAIVSVYEAGLAGKFPWIAMELIPGTDLASMIKQWQTHPPSNRLALVESICRDICGALSHIHGAGLIHRDLKPSNILVTPEHRAKLTDFGVVKAPFGQFQTQLTAIGSLVGTAAFMSPEQISGTTVDGRSDLYSLGAVMYVMLTGMRPITADTVAGYLARHLNEAPRDPRELNPRISRKLAHICLRLLEKDPDQRFSTADQVLQALNLEDEQQEIVSWGRSAELAQLLSRMATSGAKRGGLVILECPPGCGRTSLLQKLYREAEAAGHGISTGSAGDPELIHRLGTQVPAYGNADGGSSPARVLADRTRGRPWNLLIDDLEQIEPQQLKALTGFLRQHVSLEGNPLLIVVATTHRSGAIGAFCSGVTTGMSTDSVVLSPLNASSILGLLRDLGVTGPAGSALAQRLVRAKLTWPGPIIDRVEALIRDGWLQQDGPSTLRLGRTLEALETEPLPVPNRARDLLKEALEQLEPAPRTVVHALAVLGGEADPATLAHITEQPSDRVGRAITMLARAGFVVEHTTGIHMLVRVDSKYSASALYDMIPDPERLLLHQRVARALKRGRGRARAGEVAHHLVRGGLYAEALPLLLRAASSHIRGNRSAQASALLDEAEQAQTRGQRDLEPSKRLAFARELALLQADLAEQMGQYEQALDAWQRALTAAETEGNPKAATRAQARLGVLELRSNSAEAVQRLRPVWQSLSRGEPLWPDVTDALATGLLAEGRVHESRTLFQQLHKLGEDVSSLAIRADALYGLATFQLAEETPSKARAALHTAETALRQTARNERWGRAMVHLAELAYARGALIAAAERAGEVARNPSVSAALRIAGRSLLLHCADALGDSSSAVPQSTSLLEDVTTVQASGSRRWALHARAARGLLAIGRPRQAESLLDPDLADVWTGLDENSEPGLSDPPGQIFALRARVTSDVDLASADAWSALGRDLPRFPIPAARIAIDAAHGLVQAADPSAEDAVMEALDRTNRPELGLLRLEAAWLGHSIDLVSDDDLTALTHQVARDSGEQPDLSRRWL